MAASVRSSSSNYNAIGNTQVITKPTGTVEGDLLLYFGANDIDEVAGGWNDSTNTWDEVIVDVNGVGRMSSVTIRSRIATSSEPADYTFTLGAPGDETDQNSGLIVCITGQDATWQDTLTAFAERANDATPASVNFTPTADGCLVLQVLFSVQANAIDNSDAPSGYDGQVRTAIPGAAADSPVISVAYLLQTTATATGTADWWASNTSATVDSQVIGIAIASAAGGAIEGTATVTYGGTLAGTGTVAHLGTATANYGGTVAATGQVHRSGTGSAAYGGTVAAAGTSAKVGTGTMAYGGALAATGTAVSLGTGAVTYGGAVAASGTATRLGTGTLGYGGSVAGAGTIPTGTVEGTATLTYGGTVTAAGTPTRLGTATANYGGTVAATGQPTRLGTGALSYGGTVAGSGVIPTGAVLGTGTMAYGGALAATGTAVSLGTGAASYGGAVAVDALAVRLGTMLLAYGGATSTTGTATRLGTGTLTYGGAAAVAVDTDDPSPITIALRDTGHTAQVRDAGHTAQVRDAGHTATTREQR